MRKALRSAPTWYVLHETMRGPIKVKALRLAASSALTLVLGACGGGDDAPPPSDEVDQCVPHLAKEWTPTWHPPRAPQPGACTQAQVDANFMACHSASGSETACSAFRTANRTCNDCLFTDEKEGTYGPIIWLADGSWRLNTGACIAVVDRDMSPQGCGARVQAASACPDDACDGCEPFDKFLECWEKASSTVCRTRHFDSICELRPEYTVCADYETNEDRHHALANFFCVKGPVATRAGHEGDGR